MQRRFVDAVEQLVALVHTLEGDIAVLRVQVDRLEKVGPKPRKSAAEKAALDAPKAKPSANPLIAALDDALGEYALVAQS
jgi:hypothetical protein